MLKLVPRSPAGSAHMPIDSFLRTLADVQGSQAIGVILSGMGSDGTLGLQAIEAEGGIAFAQEPASAKNDDMPRSAITAGGVDFVLTPEDIARELTRLGRHPYLATGRGARAAADAPADATEDRADDDHEGLARVLELLRQGQRHGLQRLQEDDAAEAHRTPHGREPHRDARRVRAPSRRRRGGSEGPVRGLPHLGHLVLP